MASRPPERSRLSIVNGRKPMTLNIVIVGVGPRGLSVLERILANERANTERKRVTVHVIDPFPPGPGRVWRTGQAPELLMNTVTSQVTMFTDDTVSMDGPVEPGPSLWEWADWLRDLTADRAAALGYGEEVLEQARVLSPDAYPSRAFYGCYLEYVFRRVVAHAPAHVRVRVHRAQAVALDDEADAPDAAQTLTLDNGARIEGLDAAVLCQGHVGADPTRGEKDVGRGAERRGIVYVSPCNPADLDLSTIAPGENVLLRGLGLNFFDYLALLTVGRGGRFERVGETLAYVPSGREPRLFATSRRGVPHHARGENEKRVQGRHEPLLLTPEYIEELRRRSREGEYVRFRTHLWPLIAKEVETTYYSALLALQGQEQEAKVLVKEYPAATGTDEERALLDRIGIGPEERWDWNKVAHPHRGHNFTGPEEFRLWLLDHLRGDLVRARRGNVTDPVKAALDVLRDLRNEVRLAVDHRGLEGNSHRDELQGWYTPLNAFLSIGPPASRLEEMIALIETRVLEVLGPSPRITVDEVKGRFTAVSDAVPREPVTATALIEARLPEPDLERTSDPLLRQLLATGQCTAYSIPGEHGTEYRSGGLSVSERPYRLIDARGRVHPRRFAYGVPTESVHWVTAAGVRPCVKSMILTDSDAIARAVLHLTPVSRTWAHTRDTAPKPVSDHWETTP